MHIDLIFMLKSYLFAKYSSASEDFVGPRNHVVLLGGGFGPPRGTINFCGLSALLKSIVSLAAVYAETVKSIEMPFAGADSCEPRNRVLDANANAHRLTLRLDLTVTNGWMARGSHSFTCNPHVYPRMEWAILHAFRKHSPDGVARVRWRTSGWAYYSSIDPKSMIGWVKGSRSDESIRGREGWKVGDAAFRP